MAVFELDHLHEILQTLRRNRLRTFLTACGIFWGVFMLVVMLGFGRGLEKAVEEDIGFWAINNIGFRSDATSKPYGGRQAGRRVFLTLEDIAAVNQVPGVKVAWGRNHFPGSTVSREDKTMSGMVTGDYPEIFETEASVLTAGRLLNPLDIAEARRVAVIGTRVRDNLFGKEDPIGKDIKLMGGVFQVVGVLDASTAGPGGRQDFLSTRVFLPRPTIARIMGWANRVNTIPILLDNTRPSVDVEAEVKALLKARHKIAPDDERAIQGFNRDKAFKRFTNLFIAIQTLTWIVGVLTLAGGGDRGQQHHDDRRGGTHPGDRDPQGHRGDAAVDHGADRGRGDAADRAGGVPGVVRGGRRAGDLRADREVDAAGPGAELLFQPGDRHQPGAAGGGAC